MASSETSQPLTKRSSDTALMPPPPAPKRIKRPAKVLDEDTYTDALSHIIARDFFPGLLETHTQQEYLDALDSQDNAWIAEAGRKLIQVMTPGPDGRRIRGKRGTSITPVMGMRGGETPRSWGGAETPLSVADSEASTTVEKKEEVDLNLSLSAFQAKYTSEDNEAFNKLLDKQNAKRFEKYAWLHTGNKIPGARQIAYQTREAKLLEESTSSALTLRPSQDLDQRPAQPNSAPNRPRNALMFNPDSVEDTHTTSFEIAEAASNAPPRAVIYDNTRLPALPNATDFSCPPSPTLSAVRDAIAGRLRPTDSEPGYNGSETPRVNGYAFVDAEPDEREQPAPTDLLERFASADKTPNPFHIKETGKREQLHLRMVEKLTSGKKDESRPGNSALGLGLGVGALAGGETPRFRSAPNVAKGNLTPAGMRLFERVGTPREKGGAFGGMNGGSGSAGNGSGLRNQWTPTPRVRRKV
ncbi:hypothetical protein K432DRAFT_377779 [Lepidopterella palustris CBS 459.81]|uniref:Nuclear protein DGCR14 n=1 Tax=Lepidopterella palustris CBS 459.81 TaxID=1314670 RepID=A0A8E2EJZ4_9PEZI|nr:hypothetical protein K432DRAFT_377779 [Lepidopterella palustris CBS 459.81]